MNTRRVPVPHHATQSNKRRAYRSAFSLIEMVGLILILGSMMSLVGMIIHRCTAIQKLALQTVRLERQLDDLRNSVVQDVERLSHCTVDQGEVLKLQAKERRVEYRRDQNALVRQAFDASGRMLEQQHWPVEVIEFQPKVDENGKCSLVHFQLRASLLTQPDVNKSQDSKSRKYDDTSSRIILWSVRLGGNSDAR